MLGVKGYFGKQLLGLCMVGEVLVLGVEQGQRNRRESIQHFWGMPVAHPHPVLETEPHHLKHSSKTQGSEAVPVLLISGAAGLCYMDISR